MKKMISLFLFLSILFTCTAFAETKDYSFTFTDTAEVKSIKDVEKSDNQQSWFFSIKSGNVSTTNILGVRPRRGTQAASSYYIFTKLKKKAGQYYYKKELMVKQGDQITLHLKKDDQSSSTDALTVSGFFTP